MANWDHTQTNSIVSKFNNPTTRRTWRRLGYVGIVPLLSIFLLLLLFGFLSANPTAVMAAASTYFVTDTGTGANTCMTDSPCSLFKAIDLAVDGDEIRVAQGTYESNTNTPVFTVSEAITITGGYVYNSATHSWSATASPSNITTLDGNGNGRVIEIEADASPIIQNFHVQNGSAAEGGGIYIADGDGRVVLNYNAIHNNEATAGTLGGGGIYDGGGTTLNHNSIYNNSAEDGAGIYFNNDNATISSTISFNDIYSNTGSSGGLAYGGGIYLDSGAKVHFVGNKIYDNVADIGGGIAFVDATFSMHSNLMYSNRAENAGGAIWSNGATASIWNNTIVSNTAANEGAGLYIAAGTTEIHNTIIYTNVNEGVDPYSGLISVAGATITGTYNNISAGTNSLGDDYFLSPIIGDPAFVNLAGQNFHITSGSAARNTGDPLTPSDINLDIDEQPRPNTADSVTRQDVGADEYYVDFREVSLSPATESGFVEKGTTAVFTHTLRNEGSQSDTYTITCANTKWAVDICSSVIGPVAPGETEVFNTEVTIPGSASAYQDATTLITATSQADNAIFAQAAAYSIVAPQPQISFTPNYSRTELPGEIITLTHVLTNTGDSFENFIVTRIFDPNNWAELIPTEPITVPIGKNEQRTIQVQITVPEFASAGISNTIKLQAASQFNPEIFATVVNTITAKATIGTRFVSKGGASTDVDNNCTQSNKPCSTIAHAVGQAASGDEIRIASGTYNESDIQINDVFNISGGWTNFNDDGQGEEPDPSLTIIDAELGGTKPVFVINQAKPTISVLTMKNGNGGNGGAVLVNNPASPQFENVVFENNHASTRGGAVFISNNATATIQKGVFMSNTASFEGGAIYAPGGTLYLRQSSFLTNTASSNGGAISLLNSRMTGQNNLFHNNNTVSGDGGAVYLQNGTVAMNFSTWVNNTASSGGGVYNNGADLTIQSSIFSENSASSGSAIFDDGSASLDYLNMWQNESNVVTGTHSFTADPLFIDGVLFRLGLGSPAIDTANAAGAPSIDFEDDDRPSDEGFDMGYDERAGCRAKRGDVTYGNIQSAVDADSDDTLILVSGICRGVHALDYESETINQTVHLTKSVTIQGGWNSDFSEQFKEPTIVDPEGRGRGFFIFDGISVTVEAISVTNGSAAGLGGGPSGQDAGGGFYNVDGQVTLRGVDILTNTADLGAGFYNDDGNPHLTWQYIENDPRNDGEESYILTQLSGGTAVSGGGIYNNTGDLYVDGAWMHHNQATSGGGLFNLAGPITVANTIIDSNNADNGAGLYNQAITATYVHMTVYSNTATVNGGGFYNAAGQPTIHSNIFESNNAVSGSAIFDNDAGIGASANYNYYYANSGNDANAVVGTDAGSDSFLSAQAPGLTDPLAGDFHLVDDALAAERGDPLSPISYDFEDDTRPANQDFDIGADEIAGCLVQLGDVVYGSLQAAIYASQPGDELKVSGNCSGVHDFDGGSGGACGTDMKTAVHITQTISLSGGWDEEFREQKEEEFSILDAKNQGRVIYIGEGISTTIENFAIINGSIDNGAGICIDNNAQPTLRQNRIYSNTASNNGGGIYSLNSQPLFEGGNHIRNNDADLGGGFFVTGNNVITATIQNNFIYNNTANSGAGVHNNSGDHVYWHNTLYGNVAVNNGGGVEIAGGSPDIRGNILMANEATIGGDIHITAPGTPTTSYNDYYLNTPQKVIGTETGAISVDPNFANIISGVFTITINSPVVDINIPDMPLTTDFEGNIRPSHQGFDLGADEVGGCYATILGKEETVYGSVQKAVDEAVADDTVLVDGICQNVNTQIIDAKTLSQTLFIDKNITIDGSDESWTHPDDTSTVTTTLQANGKGRVVYIASGATVTLTNIIMNSGDATLSGDTAANGGGIYNNGDLRLITTWVQKSTATSGGGLYNVGELLISESFILTNTTILQDGGGIYNNASGHTTTIENSRISGNKTLSSGNGAGIYQQAGTLNISKNRIYNNNANGDGAGIYLNNSGGGVEVSNNFIYNNIANNDGGGLYNANTDANVWHNTFFENTAQNVNGAGIAIAGGTSDVRNNIIDQNVGSGLYASGGTLTSGSGYNNVVGNSGVNYNPDTPGILLKPTDISSQPNYEAPYEDDFHLRSGSPGEDVGDSTVPVNDDIDDDVRPNNGGPDIGADEINSCLVRAGGTNGEIFTVLQDAIDFAYDNNVTSIEIARGECRGVKLDAGTGTKQVGIISSTLHFTGSLRRSDFGYPSPTDYDNPKIRSLTTMINAADEGHTLFITGANNNSTFHHIAFVNGNAVAGGGVDGGAIHKEGSGEIQFSYNYFCDSTAVNGAGIYINANSRLDATAVRIGYCSVKQLTEDENGAVDYDNYRTITFIGNQASSSGGGFYTDGPTSIRNVGIYSNTAEIDGGGGYISAIASSGNELINATFYTNTARTGNGGGLYNARSNVEVLHNTIGENVAGNTGGGIYNEGSGFILNSSIVYTNTASGAADGISSSSGTLSYNNFYPGTSRQHPGLTNSNPIDGEPGLRAIRSLHTDSVNIDRADPALLTRFIKPIKYDFQAEYRPDGDEYLPYVSPHGIYADVGADEYYKDFGCKVEASDNPREVQPGSTITYTVSVINTGNPSYLDIDNPYDANGFPDTITVTLANQSQGWSSLIGGDEQIASLGWNDDFWRIPEFGYMFGEGTTYVLSVTVPSDAQVGASEVSTIRCESASLPDLAYYQTSVTTNVGEAGGVSVTPDYYDKATPGEIRVYTQTVTNLQNQEATYLLTAKSGLQHANAILLDPDTMTETNNIVVTLAPSGTGKFTTTAYIQVEILETAIAGEFANPGLIATDMDPTSDKFDSSTNQTEILGEPATRYVAGGGNNNTNCAVAIQPCGTIQYAIKQAYDEDGNIDDIKVAAFTYSDYTTSTINSDTRQQVLFINKSVSISGGYTTTEQTPFTTQSTISNPVYLDGNGQRRVIYVAAGITPTINSVIIQNGNSVAGDQVTTTQDFGGGIYNEGADLTIHSSRIQNNQSYYGAGIFHADGLLTLYSTLLDVNNNFETGFGEGGGLYLAAGSGLIENNTFTFNKANKVAAPSKPIFAAVSAASTGFGGGIFVDEPALITVTNNIFSNNSAEEGTAIYISGTASISNTFNLYDPVDTPNTSTIANGSYGEGHILADPMFEVDSYHISTDSPAKDVGTPTVSISQSVDIDLEDRFMGIQIDIGADERLQAAGFIFEPTVLSNTINQGEVFTYFHAITNTGDFTDSYTLTPVHNVIPSGGPTWDYDLSPTSINLLAPGDSVQVSFVITGGQPGYMDVTTITATSASGLSASVQDTTRITQTAVVTITESSEKSGVPGQILTYTHTLTNGGNGLDEFTLTGTAVPTDWTTIISPTQPFFVAAGESVPFTVTVMIPDDAISGTQHQLVVTATVSNPDAFDVLTDTTTVELVQGLTLTPDYTRAVTDGTSTIYTHTLTSETNLTDTVTLTATGSLPDWVVSIYPESVDLDPYESKIVSITVNVPLNTGGLTHFTYVTATSQLPGLVATATNTTTVPIDASLTFTPNLTETVYAGNMAYYTHTLTNLGNLTDTFNIISSSVNGWLFDITDGPFAIGPGASVEVTAVISVPLGTPPTIIDTLHITATSQADPTITATVTDTTPVMQFVDLLFTPDHDDSGFPDDPGTIKSYTHILTNTGDYTDTFALTYSGEQATWPVSFEPSTAITLAAGETAVITANLSIPSGASGLTNTTYITATSTVSPAISASVVDKTAVTGVPAVLGVLIEPDRMAVGDLSQTVTYYHIVTNTGNITDDINLSAVSASGWATTIEPTSISKLADGANAPVTVTVTIPAAGAAGTVDTTLVTAVSQSDPTVSSSVTDTIRIKQDHGLLFFPDNETTTVEGSIVVYTHTLQNTGNAQDIFDITPVSQWSAAVVSPITLEENESTTVYITLTVPADAGGQTDVMQVLASSTISPAITATAINTTTASIRQEHALLFFPDNETTTVASSTVVYTHTLQNIGNAQDTFDITPVSQWSAAVVSPITLEENESTTVYITLTVPANAGGQTDVMQVLASSTISPAITATAVNTTTVEEDVVEPPQAGVDIQPDHTEYGTGGTSKAYVHMVTNTGEETDTFTLNAVSSSRWSVTTSPASLTLAPGGIGVVTVTVNIPNSATVGNSDETTVTATSQSDSTVSDSATNTTILPGVFLPIIINGSSDGIDPTPTPVPSPTPVTCDIPTGIDLIVTQVLVEPATPTAGVPAVVHVTIRNQGYINVAPNNNFYVDFYVDQVPRPYLIGAIEWGAQGEWMGAGQSYTFSSSFIFSGGSHELRAQVDTDQTVNECPFDDNNISAPVNIFVTGTNDPIEPGQQQQQVEPNGTPRYTPTPAKTADLSNIDIQPVTTERPLSTATPTPMPIITATPLPPGED